MNLNELSKQDTPPTALPLDYVAEKKEDEEEAPTTPDTMLMAVYGTLKAGFGNNVLMRNSKFVGQGSTDPDFTMKTMGGFPGVIEVGNNAIHVEVYEVPISDIPRIDALEGHPGWYCRKKVDVHLKNDVTVSAWMYLLNAEKNAHRQDVASFDSFGAQVWLRGY